MVKELSSRRGLGKEVWVVFEMVSWPRNWKDKASSEEGSRLELQRPPARRARTERFLDTSASCSSGMASATRELGKTVDGISNNQPAGTDEYMPFVSHLKWGKDDGRQEGEEGGKQDSGESGVLSVPNGLGKPKGDSDGKSLKKVEEEVDGNEDEKGGEKEEDDGTVVEKEETRSKGKRRHKQTHKHGTESDQTRTADENSKGKENTHKRPKDRHAAPLPPPRPRRRKRDFIKKTSLNRRPRHGLKLPLKDFRLDQMYPR